MKILYATDHKSYLVKDKVYLTNRIHPILKRYSSAFGDIILYSRFIETDTPPKDAINESFIKGYVKADSLKNVVIKRDKKLEEAIGECALVIGRVPSLPSYKALDYARKQGIPTFTESMGCAWDAYWNHGIVGKAIAPYMFLKMRSLVRNADYASYVTSEFLQRRYPRKKESLSASNVLIENTGSEVIEKRIEHLRKRKPNTISLMTTAAVDVRYKGQEFVIRALPKLLNEGIDVKYYVVGDGKQDFLRAITKECHVENNVIFTGRKPLKEVFDLLDEIDIYIQPSLQEGLPRSVVEAMSRGCVVIGAKTAGIPELIDPKYVVKPKDYKAIAQLVSEINSYSLYKCASVSRRNFQKSKEFHEDVLNKRRNIYYQKVLSDLNNR